MHFERDGSDVGGLSLDLAARRLLAKRRSRVVLTLGLLTEPLAVAPNRRFRPGALGCEERALALASAMHPTTSDEQVSRVKHRMHQLMYTMLRSGIVDG